MRDGSLEEHPAAGPLLEVTHQEASGIVALAGRALWFERGDCILVGPAAGEPPLWRALLRDPSHQADPDLLAFVPAAGPDTDVLASQERAFIAQVKRRGKTPITRTQALLRALFVDRLAASLAETSPGPAALELPLLPNPQPHNSSAEDLRFPFLPLLLDSLAKGAANDLAMPPDTQLARVPGVFSAAALHWAAIGDLETEWRVATILMRRPAAAPAIAALLKAGLVRLQATPEQGRAHRLNLALMTFEAPPDSAAVLQERTSSSATKLGNGAGPGRSSVVQAQGSSAGSLAGKAGSLVAMELAEVEPLAPVYATLPELDPTLTDPLRQLELDIAKLERTSAGTPAERAQAWCKLAALWEDTLHCPTEALSALREAAAATPDDTELLQRVALLCVRCGEPMLARRYGELAVTAATHGTEARLAVHQAQRTLAAVHLRTLDGPAALEPLAAAAAGSPLAQRQLAMLQVLTGHPEAPAALVRAAQATTDNARLACGLWAEASAHTNPMAITAKGLAQALADAGYARAAAAILTDAAYDAPSWEGKRAILMQAVRHGERTHDRRTAGTVLLRLLDLFREDEPIQTALTAQWPYASIPAAERAAIAQDIALLGPVATRADNLAQAGAMAFQVPAERETGRLLVQQALAAGHSGAGTRALLGQVGHLDTPAPDVQALADALEVQLAASTSPPVQQELLRRIAALRHMLGDAERCADAAKRCLALGTAEPIVAARLVQAAKTLEDPALLREALGHLIELTPDAGHRAHHWLSLGYLAWQQGDLSAGLLCAREAMQCDPGQPLALLLVFRCQDAAEPQALATLLACGDRLFPDVPTLLWQRICLAERMQDRGLLLTLLERWVACAPHDVRPQQQRLIHRLQWGDSPAAILDAATSLLPMVCLPSQVELVAQAADFAIDMGEPGRGALLLLQLLAHTGRRDEALARRALELIRSQGGTPNLPLALEQYLITLEDTGSGEPLACLRELAEYHRQRGNALAESRTWLRLLGRAPEDRQACLRLAAFFARIGDAERLEAVQRLLLRSESDPQQRQQRWLLMASARLRLAGDGAGAERLLQEMVGEGERTNATAAPDGRSAMEAAAGLLLGLFSDLARGMWHALEFSTALPATQGAALALRLCRTAWEQADDPQVLLQFATEAALRYPNDSALLQLLEALGHLQGAEDALQRVHAQRLEPSA